MRVKNMMLDKHTIDIYPRVLWVAGSLTGLDKVFKFMRVDNTSVENASAYTVLLDDYDRGESGMVTIPVVRRSDGLLGVLVIAMDINHIAPDMIPHESVHVADYIYEELGMYAQGFSDKNEQYAYLVGWIAGKISGSVSKFKESKTEE